MEARNMVHSDSMSPVSPGTWSKLSWRCTNNSQDPSPHLEGKGGYPLIHRGKLQYAGTELGSNKNRHPCPSPLTIGNSRVVESPTPLEKTDSRALAVCQEPGSAGDQTAKVPAFGRYRKHNEPDPLGPSCRCVHHSVWGLPPQLAPETLCPQLKAATSAMEAENMVHANIRPVVRSTDNKVDHRLLAQDVLLPCAITDTLINEHGVGHGQTVMNTKVQYQNNTHVREVVPPNHTPAGVIVNVHMGIEVPQNNYGVPSQGNIKHPPRDSKKAGSSVLPFGKQQQQTCSRTEDA
ncbi:hypothetical protein D4764_07G0000920 [Takifugu flavidus]|uniref:Uncharacterized protein n=1 Tax=Takifugu flavidus TaxID=433684 RepID=A0A5C6MR27_9TELE|nr:hypothetical protein D4764_07G0000920 [Takifugu flavidus]